MSTPPRWRRSEAFGLLCDLVADGKVIAMTGAGFSSDLIGNDGQPLPRWSDLLSSIADDLAPPPKRPAAIDALAKAASTGQDLIELASMLSALDSKRFADLVRAKLTPRAMASQPPAVAAAWRRKHEALLALMPLGIVTMNIDELHERQLRRKQWKVICPLDEDADAAIRETIRSLGTVRFILQAHGSLTQRARRAHHGLVFTWESYRDLIVNRPSYVGFMAHLFTSCNFLFVGYGLSDLDFDQFLWGEAARFGAATRDHVVFQRWRRGSSSKAAADRNRLIAASSINAKRYGIRTVWMDEWSDIADVLEAARSTAGPRLERTITQCFSATRDERRAAHDHLRHLGEAGKAIATQTLLQVATRTGHSWQKDEAIYALGRLEPKIESTRRCITRALLDVAMRDKWVSPVAHALSTLQYYVEERDLQDLEAVSRRVRAETLREGGEAWERDPDDRLPVYAEYLVRRVRARHEVTTPRRDAPTFR